ncbi:hypothetical protein RintRC_1069 [Richelia intracellularis]|nr:hypothetical protein RintRC_1069 [Richelia intracellularis]
MLHQAVLHCLLAAFLLQTVTVITGSRLNPDFSQVRKKHLDEPDLG